MQNDSLSGLDMETDDFIFWLYRKRCIWCHKIGTDVNEILPRSSGGSVTDHRNRVLACRECHSKYHHDGVDDVAMQNLKELRVDVLTAIGRERYI